VLGFIRFIRGNNRRRSLVGLFTLRDTSCVDALFFRQPLVVGRHLELTNQQADFLCFFAGSRIRGSQAIFGVCSGALFLQVNLHQRWTVVGLSDIIGRVFYPLRVGSARARYFY
jgi:hypothetical protein